MKVGDTVYIMARIVSRYGNGLLLVDVEGISASPTRITIHCDDPAIARHPSEILASAAQVGAAKT